KGALEKELFHRDVVEAVSILKQASGKEPYIWTPDESGRKSLPERAVWLGIDADRFDLDCLYYPISSNGRARGVRQESAEGVQKKETTSPKIPSVTAEPALEERIAGVLSKFDQLKSKATTELYNTLKQQALEELRKLYHG
ncbi:MAG: hypothetical protein AABX05_06070, partial [Nanoarchaeota archaeon]